MVLWPGPRVVEATVALTRASPRSSYRTLDQRTYWNRTHTGSTQRLGTESPGPHIRKTRHSPRASLDYIELQNAELDPVEGLELKQCAGTPSSCVLTHSLASGACLCYNGTVQYYCSRVLVAQPGVAAVATWTSGAAKLVHAEEYQPDLRFRHRQRYIVVSACFSSQPESLPALRPYVIAAISGQTLFTSDRRAPNVTQARPQHQNLDPVRKHIAFVISTVVPSTVSNCSQEFAKLVDRFGVDAHRAIIEQLWSVFLQPRAPSHQPPPPSLQLSPQQHACSQLLRYEAEFASRSDNLAVRFLEASRIAFRSNKSVALPNLEAHLTRLGLEPGALQALITHTNTADGPADNGRAPLAASMFNGSAPPNGGGSGDAGGGSNASSEVVKAALDALSREGPGSGLSSDQHAALLETLLSDAGPNPPLLHPAQRQRLLNAVAAKVGRDATARAVKQALPNLKLKPEKNVADFLIEFGAHSVSNADVALAIFERFGITKANPPDERTVTEILALLLSVDAAIFETDRITKFGEVVFALGRLNEMLSWPRIVRGLDELEGFTPTPSGCTLGMAEILSAAPMGSQVTAASGLWGPWSHKLRQLQIFHGLLSLPRETFSFASLPGRRILAHDDVADAPSPAIKETASSLVDSSYNSLDLIETLIEIAASNEQAVLAADQEVLEKAVKTCPELVLLGLVQIPQPWNGLHSELASRLLAMFLSGHPSGSLVFYRIWRTNRDHLLSAFRSFYLDSQLNLTKIAEVTQSLGIVEEVVDAQPFAFALDLAAVSAPTKAIDLDAWLQDKIDRHGSDFIRAVLEFLDVKAKDDLAKPDPHAEQNFVPLTVHSVASFLKALRSNGDSMSPEEIDFFKGVRNVCLQLHPRLMNLAPGAEGQEPGLQVVDFSQEIHEEADSWYRQMYDGKISIEDIVTLLQRTKASDETRDHQIFACMVHTLFDEYRWFEMYYPPRELEMTAVVFGSLIQYQLIDFIPLGIAIRYVLDALRNPPESNMFKFGLQALLRFQNRLPEWPQLCQALLSMPHLQQSYPNIIRLVKMALAGQLSGSSSGAGGLQPEEAKAPFSAIRADPLPEDDGQREPEEEASDKVLFIVNNLSPSNIDAKLGDARRLITPDLYRWFSYYLVLQRISIEPNNHGLYAQFLDGLDGKDLLKYILHETLAKCKMLLNSEKTVQSTQERNLLKNLGSWLGSLTLARDKPIRHRNLAFKELLIEGYDSNRLIVAIPFVCKVVEQCARSNVFKPPNPWLMAVLRLMVELYQFAELKLNLKFEIEVLFKGLNVELKDVQPTTILRNRPTVELLEQQQQQQQQQQLQQQNQQPLLHSQQQQGQGQFPQPFGQQQQTGPMQLLSQQQQQQAAAQMQLQQQRQHQQQLSQQPATGMAQDLERLSLSGGYSNAAAGGGRLGGPQSQKASAAAAAVAAAGTGAQPGQSAAATAAYNEALVSMLQTLPQYVVINPQLTLLATNPGLKRLICIAIDRAIREIIAPVVERSVTIASISTRELITKDFAMEGDEVKMRKAAHQMAQNLAGSLALVTCKEPLRISMVTHARSLLLANGFSEQNLPEQALMVVMQENLDLACSVIEKAAMDKAVPEVDDGLTNAYSTRREHRARGRGYYWDTAALAASQYAATLPDLLRLRPEGLQPAQLRVYDDFSRRMSPGLEGADRGTPGSVHASITSGRSDAGGYPDSTAANDERSLAMPGVVGAAGAAGAGGATLSAQQSLEKFSQAISELERLVSEADQDEAFASLPQDHDVRHAIRRIPMVAAQTASRDETALAFSQKVVQLLFMTESKLGREVYVVLLERLCEISLKAAREVTAWLVYADDARKFNVPVTVALIRAGLINIAELDVQLAKLVVRDFRANVVDFSAELALDCLGEPACATRQQLTNTIEALNRAGQRGKATEASTRFLEELDAGQLKSKVDVGNTALREQLAYCFAEWVRLFQHSPNAEKSFIDYVTQLQTQGILRGEDISSMFFRVCTEVSVDSYIKQKAVGGSPATGIFAPIDAFSKLIVLMIKYHADPTGANNEQAKVHYLTKILSIVVLVLAQSHEELGMHFQQKPFFRLFSSLLHDLHATESSLGNAYVQTLLAVSNTLNTLQPSFFPGFTFSWTSLISHRLFMPKLLEASNQEGWSAFHRLFASLLRFMAPFLRSLELQDTSRQLYRGTLRILLVLLHDYPEFLCDYHQSMCDLIPASCIQLRNLVLSAFPRNRRLPDPFTPNLQISMLAEMEQAPHVASDYLGTLAQVEGLREALDAQLERRGAPVEEQLMARLDEAIKLDEERRVKQHQQQQPNESEYNVPLINAVVLYLGMQAIETGGGARIKDGEDAALAILSRWVMEAEPEVRFLVLTAAANQLRFPSSHTAYFHGVFLHLFGAGETEMVREQIMRVLLERLIINRPHPWGLLVTFVELMRTHGHRMPRAPGEIQALLDHIGSTLGNGGSNAGENGHGPQQSGQVNGFVGSNGNGMGGHGYMPQLQQQHA
ncbi:Not1-domain-containing protein [Testicularia cyperi]|uniref:General negative regulator of transcription subunit 1 n=1 Tax=Testicularia cyperi TaxID=1882483 RepID=A0A317XNG5_9BASI|nr:Not1-domain-containing protein [Testicularia cyperi]